MAKTIHLLSEITINQIAAGEVIENPASVIKELVENSVDAGATQITIETRGGGFQLIKISDDGCGMNPEDAVLSLQRHATSKIKQADDLFSLSTMGFRGEALASIAAISKLDLLTCTEEGPAIRVRVEGGKVEKVHPDARTRGTTIEILSLFYNVPARKEFQKSASASSSEITRTLTQLSLAHPTVGFTLIQQGKTLFSLPAFQSLKERALPLLGQELINQCQEISFSHKECLARGLISSPGYTRQNRSGQYLFINKRPVQCLPIAFAIKDAYGTFLSTGEHPLYLLHLDIPPSEIDVNVHPQKKEVRLKQESVIKYGLTNAITDTLSLKTQDTSFPSAPAFDFSCFEPPSPYLVLHERAKKSEQLTLQLPLAIHPIGLYGHYLLVHAQGLPLDYAEPGFFFFHLQACQKRILFEKMLLPTIKESQILLLPISFTLSVAETQKLLIHLPLIDTLGLHIEQVGKTAFLISAIPPFVEEQDVLPLVHRLIEEEHSSKESFCSLFTESAPAYPLSITQGVEILRELFKTQDPHHCPKGTPTYFFFKEQEIEKRLQPS